MQNSDRNRESVCDYACQRGKSDFDTRRDL